MAEEEFSAVVADNGSGTCNTEFAGDDAPRVELPSIIDRPKTPGIMVDTEEKDSNVGDDVQCKRGVSTVKHHIYDFSLLCGDLDIDPIIDEPMDTPEEQRKKSKSMARRRPLSAQVRRGAPSRPAL